MYDPDWCSWVGGANENSKHYSFWNQFDAGHANFKVFARNLVPLLDAHGAQQLKAIVDSFPAASKMHLHQAMSVKLGVATAHPAFEQLLSDCLEVMKNHKADWTMFWRQLAELRSMLGSVDDAGIATVMVPAFYASGIEKSQVSHAVQEWVGKWMAAAAASSDDASAASAAMKQASPKYVCGRFLHYVFVTV
jgi:uncharacterized protein YdiU (UPF0061 family)